MSFISLQRYQWSTEGMSERVDGEWVKFADMQPFSAAMQERHEYRTRTAAQIRNAELLRIANWLLTIRSGADFDSHSAEVLQKLTNLKQLVSQP